MPCLYELVLPPHFLSEPRFWSYEHRSARSRNIARLLSVPPLPIVWRKEQLPLSGLYPVRSVQQLPFLRTSFCPSVLPSHSLLLSAASAFLLISAWQYRPDASVMPRALHSFQLPESLLSSQDQFSSCRNMHPNPSGILCLLRAGDTHFSLQSFAHDQSLLLEDYRSIGPSQLLHPSLSTSQFSLCAAPNF